MMGPRKAAEVFDAYIRLLILTESIPSLRAIADQYLADDRLSFNQRQALQTIRNAREDRIRA